MSVKAMTWVWSLALKSNQKFVLLALADHADDEGRCWPSIEKLAVKCGISRSAVNEHLKTLVHLGLIVRKKRCSEQGYRASNLYFLKIGLNPAILLRKNLSRNIPSLSPDLPASYSQNLDSNHQELSKESSLLVEVKEIFHYWQTVMNYPNAKLDDKRQRKIASALKNYSVLQLKQAIDGCMRTPFNMGENDRRQKFNSIELILRDAEHIERFIQHASEFSLSISNNSGNHDIFTGAL